MAAPRNPSSPRSRYNGRRGRGTIGPASAVIELPAAGCTLPVPDMPAGREWTDHERARWTELWESPQANAWDETARGTVASLVIYETAIMSGVASAWMAQEARHASEALGLTPKSMLSLGWRVVEP